MYYKSSSPQVLYGIVVLYENPIFSRGAGRAWNVAKCRIPLRVFSWNFWNVLGQFLIEQSLEQVIFQSFFDSTEISTNKRFTFNIKSFWKNYIQSSSRQQYLNPLLCGFRQGHRVMVLSMHFSDSYRHGERNLMNQVIVGLF